MIAGCFNFICENPASTPCLVFRLVVSDNENGLKRQHAEHAEQVLEWNKWNVLPANSFLSVNLAEVSVRSKTWSWLLWTQFLKYLKLVLHNQDNSDLMELYLQWQWSCQSCKLRLHIYEQQLTSVKCKTWNDKWLSRKLCIVGILLSHKTRLSVIKEIQFIYLSDYMMHSMLDNVGWSFDNKNLSVFNSLSSSNKHCELKENNLKDQ